MEINQMFGSCLQKEEVLQMSPLTLAFVGDGIHTMFVRDYVIKSQVAKIGDYHTACAKYCKAQSQANVLDNIQQMLTDQELDVVRRARNAKTHNIAKNSDYVTYKKATSFEALVGYLYLIGDIERLNQILKLSLGE